MQTPRGATADELAAAMVGKCRVSPLLQVLDSEENPLTDITPVTEGGQVSWLHGGDVTRTLTLDIADPEHELALDSDSPSDGAVYADRMVKVIQRFESDALPQGWAEVEVFTGPLVRFTRRNSRVALEMQGKEQRARTDVPSLKRAKGMRIVDAIESIMRLRCGEERFDFPKGVNDRLSKPVHVGRNEEHQPWKVCQRLADSIGMQLYYDGRGKLVLREPPTSPVFTVTPEVSSEPELSHDWSQVYNRVAVKWSRKQGRRNVKGQVSMTLADLYPGHPFAPVPMGRNGVRWERTLLVDNEKIPTPARARNVARKRLADASMQQLDVRVSIIPAWHLDPLDMVALPDGTDFQWREAQAGVMGGPMQVGSVESVRRPRR